jgi:hypothetical protein
MMTCWIGDVYVMCLRAGDPLNALGIDGEDDCGEPHAVRTKAQITNRMGGLKACVPPSRHTTSRFVAPDAFRNSEPSESFSVE